MCSGLVSWTAIALNYCKSNYCKTNIIHVLKRENVPKMLLAKLATNKSFWATAYTNKSILMRNKSKNVNIFLADSARNHIQARDYTIISTFRFSKYWLQLTFYIFGFVNNNNNSYCYVFVYLMSWYANMNSEPVFIGEKKLINLHYRKTELKRRLKLIINFVTRVHCNSFLT